MRVAVHQLEVAGQLLDAVDLAAALDLDRDAGAARVLREDVDRADGGHVLAPHERPAVAEGVDVLGEQLLQVRLDAVLDEAGVDAELVGRVVEDLVDEHRQAVLALGVLDRQTATTPSAAWPSSGSTSAIVQGGDIQLSGL